MGKTQALISVEAAIKQIQDEFSQATDEHVVRINQVSQEVAAKLTEYLDLSEEESSRITYDSQYKNFRIVHMPTPTHEAHIDWMYKSLAIAFAAGRFTPQEFDDLRLSAGDRNTLNNPVYQMSTKEPDGLVIPSPVAVPTIVVESGWSEEKRDLLRDKDIWLRGFPGQVQKVILIKWRPNYGSREVSGELEVHRRPTAPNQPTLVQSEAVFPPPSRNAASQVVQLTKAELFAGWPTPVQNPTQQINFTLDRLRSTAEKAMATHGFHPKTRR